MIDNREILGILYTREGLEKRGFICNDHELNIFSDFKDI
jgi:hypothetical protein